LQPDAAPDSRLQVSLRTEVAQQIRSNTELRDLLDASQSAHSMTKTALSDKQMALSDAEEVTRQLQGNLERREASLKDVEQTLEETMRHHSQQQYVGLCVYNHSLAMLKKRLALPD